MRTALRWLFVAAVAVTFVSAGSIASACDSAKADAAKASASASCASKADAAKASAEKCASKTESANAANASASGSNCTAAQVAACASKAKMASANGKTCTAAEVAACASKAGFASYSIKGYLPELTEAEESVEVTVIETETGVTMSFAAASPEVAQAVAAKASAMLSKSAACDMSRASMAKAGGFTHCTKSVQAFAGCNVTVENTDGGAVSTIKASEAVPVTELHAVFHNLQEKQVEETVKG